MEGVRDLFRDVARMGFERRRYGCGDYAPGEDLIFVVVPCGGIDFDFAGG